MSAPDGIDFGRSRAVLIGTAAYTEGLEPMSAAANSLRRMEDLLVGLCGWPSSSVTPFKDLSTGDPRLRKVSKLIEEATDVLLLYYVGHGVLLPGDDLGLALTDTDANAALHLTTTYRLRTLREQLRYHCHARLKLIILDCCFAGIATRNAQGPGGLADRVDHASRIEGTYTWTASRASQEAVYEDGAGGLTYFTKILHEVIATGIPGKPAWLTLADVDLAVAQRFQELPLPNTLIRPEPTRLAVGGLPGLFPFAPNAALTPVSRGTFPGVSKSASASPPPGNGRVDQAHGLRILEEALDVIQSTYDVESHVNLELLVEAVLGAAQLLARTDPQRAARLINDAETSVTSAGEHEERALIPVAAAWAATDAQRAERVARSIRYDGYRNEALLRITQVLCATDLDHAERIALSISEDPVNVRALITVARAVTDADPGLAGSLIDHAEHAAQEIGYWPSQVEALIEVSQMVASRDPERAARLINDAESATVGHCGSRRAQALTDIARALAGTDPFRASRLIIDAERLAQQETDRETQQPLLAGVAKVLAVIQPDRAERVAKSITHTTLRASTLIDIAKMLGAVQPDRANRLINDAERAAQLCNDDPNTEVKPLVDVAEALTAAQPDRAVQVAESIVNDFSKVSAMIRVAKVLAAADPLRAVEIVSDAEQIAQSMWSRLKAHALLEIAKTWCQGL